MKRIVSIVVVFMVSAGVFGAASGSTRAGRIHCVTDISHEFTFYFDGRFGKNYVGENGVDVRNWGTLHKYDLSNCNLLILQSGASPCRYLREDMKAVERFMNAGGGVVVLGDYSLFRNESRYRLNTLAKYFGAEFVRESAKKPLKGCAVLEDEKIESYSAKLIKLDNRFGWEVLVRDNAGGAVMAERKAGKGRLVVASRQLCGRNPNASDPINQVWWKALLQDISSGKAVDAKRRPSSRMPENESRRQRLPIQYSDYMKSYADAIYDVYDECFPVIEEVMGVPPSEGMLTKLILLPTGGGGFSSGSSIGLAGWWGGFPEKKYGMVELISHESTHSWVHPFTEPMWNEGIATYVGILVGRKLGLEEDASSSLAGWIKSARGDDPEMNKYDLANGKDVPHGVGMGKPMWIFEELANDKPDIVARYFQTKRRVATPEKIKKYTADDSVSVLSIAAGRDLFAWFRSLGITVERSKSQIEIQ
ncbi:MAG: hypothetical protein JW720_07205 [Sedimentisphaerales bacterium]|nr:hypothetical protein [Sedimentisphaerales bacterium]